jgi:hypothetical protein
VQGDLGVRVACEESELQHDPLLRRQLGKLAVERASSSPRRLGVCARGRYALGLLEVHHTSAARAAQPIERPRAQTQHQPGAHAATRSVVMASAVPSLQEHVMHQVLSLTGSAEKTLSQRQHLSREAIVKRTERFAIAVGHRLHQELVALVSSFGSIRVEGTRTDCRRPSR